MFTVYDDNFSLGSFHLIEDYKFYQVKNDTNGEVRTLKGSSLLNELRKDRREELNSYSNVIYNKNRQYVFKDIEKNILSPEISVDLFTSSIISNNTCFNSSIDTILKNSEVIFGDIFIDNFKISYNINYYLTLEGRKGCIITFIDTLIQVRIEDDLLLKDVVFSNINMKKNVISCIVKFNIFSKEMGGNRAQKFKITLTNNGEKRFGSKSKLSNYYICKVSIDNRVFSSSEAAYQSFKSTNVAIRDKFINLSPDEAKKLGREIEKSEYMNKNWLKDNYIIMYNILKSKFTQNEDCKEALLKTIGKELIEDTTGWHDTVWGKCYCEKCNGDGKNILGRILMVIRTELKLK